VCAVCSGLTNCVTWVGTKPYMFCTPGNERRKLEKNLYTIFCSTEYWVITNCGRRAINGVQLLDSDLAIARVDHKNRGHTDAFLSPYNCATSQEIRCLCNSDVAKSGPLWANRVRNAWERIFILSERVARRANHRRDSLANYSGGFFGNSADRVNFLHLRRSSLVVYFNVFYCD